MCGIVSDYDGYNCLPAIPNDPNITYDSVSGGMENTGPPTNSSVIVCEILKTTSFPATPANTNDAITDVEVSINNNGNSAGIECGVQVYSSFIPSGGTNVTSDAVNHTSQTGDSAISFSSGLTSTNWWGSSSSWLYAQLECELPGGTEMNSYSVTEQGTDNYFHIYPAWSLCSPADSTSSNANLYFTLGEPNGGQPAGYLQAPGGTSVFFYSCYLPGASAELSITPSDNTSSGWQWSYSYYGTSCTDGSLCSSDCWSGSTSCEETGSAYSTGSNWPSLIFPGSSSELPVPTADEVSGSGFTNFLDSSTFYYAYIRQIQANGDMEILSMRTTGDDY